MARAGLRLASTWRRDFRITITGKPFFDLSPLRAEIAAAGAADLVRIEDRHQEASWSRHAARGVPDIVAFPYREIDASGAFACASQFGQPIVATELRRLRRAARARPPAPAAARGYPRLWPTCSRAESPRPEARAASLNVAGRCRA